MADAVSTTKQTGTSNVLADSASVNATKSEQEFGQSSTVKEEL